MRLNPARHKVTATLHMPSAFHPLDAISFTHRRMTFLGRRDKTIAAFSFPRRGWLAAGEDWAVNSCANPSSLRLDKLATKAACSKVTAYGVAYGATIFEVSTTLSNFLASLLPGCEEDCCSTLRLKLVPVRLNIPTPEGAEEPFSNLQLSLFCNGRQCGAMDLILFTNQLLTVMEEESPARQDEDVG